MKENWDHAFAQVIKSEGGFVNHPKDPGGMTNLGVTKKSWEGFMGREVTEAEMRALTPEVVKPFYKRFYWDTVKGDDLPSGVDYTVFDFAVNSGPGRAAKVLQQAVKVTADGNIGPQTLAKVKEADPTALVDVICAVRLEFLQGLPTFATFGKGWTRRVQEVANVAALMTKTNTFA